MIENFIEQAKCGESIYLCAIRDAFSSAGIFTECVVELPVGAPYRYNIPVPRTNNTEEAEFVKEYFYANIYNMISVLGGKKITLYINPGDDHIEELCATLDSAFQINVPRGERTSYGKCLNVTDRVNAAMGCPPFSFEIVCGKCEKVFPNSGEAASDALTAFRGAVKAA